MTIYEKRSHLALFPITCDCCGRKLIFERYWNDDERHYKSLNDEFCIDSHYHYCEKCAKEQGLI